MYDKNSEEFVINLRKGKLKKDKMLIDIIL